MFMQKLPKGPFQSVSFIGLDGGGTTGRYTHVFRNEQGDTVNVSYDIGPDTPRNTHPFRLKGEPVRIMRYIFSRDKVLAITPMASFRVVATLDGIKHAKPLLARLIPTLSFGRK